MTRVVLQIDKNTNKVINKFYGLAEAQKMTGARREGISKCCNDKLNKYTAGGYKWKYEDERQ